MIQLELNQYVTMDGIWRDGKVVGSVRSIILQENLCIGKKMVYNKKDELNIMLEFVGPNVIVSNMVSGIWYRCEYIISECVDSDLIGCLSMDSFREKGLFNNIIVFICNRMKMNEVIRCFADLLMRGVNKIYIIEEMLDCGVDGCKVSKYISNNVVYKLNKISIDSILGMLRIVEILLDNIDVKGRCISSGYGEYCRSFWWKDGGFSDGVVEWLWRYCFEEIKQYILEKKDWFKCHGLVKSDNCILECDKDEKHGNVKNNEVSKIVKKGVGKEKRILFGGKRVMFKMDKCLVRNVDDEMSNARLVCNWNCFSRRKTSYRKSMLDEYVEKVSKYKGMEIINDDIEEYDNGIVRGCDKKECEDVDMGKEIGYNNRMGISRSNIKRIRSGIKLIGKKIELRSVRNSIYDGVKGRYDVMDGDCLIIKCGNVWRNVCEQRYKLNGFVGYGVSAKDKVVSEEGFKVN